MNARRAGMRSLGASFLWGCLLIPLTGISTCDNPDDFDGDGFSSAEGDCNDSDATIHPTAPEKCDARDNNCDGLQDEGVNCQGTIATVAGNGSAGYSGDGGLAYLAQLSAPFGLAVAPDGTYFIAENQNYCVRKVDPDGKISTYAGTTVKGYSGDGGPAIEAELSTVNDIALDGLGRLLIADFQNSAVRSVDTQGIISTVAGNRTTGYSGDGGPATEAALNRPNFIAVFPDNSFLISDPYNYRVRYVNSAGQIQTVAGDGTSEYGGDNQPAVEAGLWFPSGLALDPSGSFFIGVLGAHSIRRVTDGIMYTAAGAGYKGYYGDGGPATAALLNNPNGICFDRNGDMFFADRGNHRVRRVSTAGIIETVVGTGTAGYSGDTGPAIAAQLNEPMDVAFDAAGNLLITEYSNHTVRRVRLSP